MSVQVYVKCLLSAYCVLPGLRIPGKGAFAFVENVKAKN